MGRTHEARDHVWAVVRLDPIQTEPEHQFTVKEVVWSAALAEAEAERLNRLNADKDCRYFVQATRLFPAGHSAGDCEPGPAAEQGSAGDVRPSIASEARLAKRHAPVDLRRPT